MSIGNTPRSTTVFTLEARKSFALGLHFKGPDGKVLDITGATVRLTIAKPKHRGGTAVFTGAAEHVDSLLGVCQFELQAADLDLAAEEHPFAVTFVSALGYSTPVMKGTFDIRENADLVDTNVYDGVNPSTNLAVHLESGGTVNVTVDAIDGLSVVVDEKILAFTAEAIVLRDAAAASATAAASSATTASASATAAAASASVAQTVASGATDAVLSGILNDETSSSRATLNSVVEAEVAANPAGDGVVAGLVGDAGSATQLAVDARAAAAVDAIDYDTEMTSVLSNPASDAKMLLELEYGHASSVAVSPDGGLASTNVQDALEELDAEKSGVGHTHGYVQSVTATPGGGLTVDNADPVNPKVGLSSTAVKACRAYLSSNVTIPHNVSTVIPLDTESYDTDSMHNNSPNTRITIVTSGFYQISAKISFSMSAGAAQCRVHKNGALLSVGYAAPASGLWAVDPVVNDVFYLEAGDYLELFGLQTSGASAAVFGSSSDTYLTVTRIGG